MATLTVKGLTPDQAKALGDWLETTGLETMGWGYHLVHPKGSFLEFLKEAVEYTGRDTLPPEPSGKDQVIDKDGNVTIFVHTP